MGRDDQIQRWLQQSRRLQVGECAVDLSLNEVRRGEEVIRLTPKASGVLEVLLFIAGQPASKERLLAEVWRGECPTDDVVTHAIGELRRAFGDDPRTAAYIRTVPRVGYALVASVAETPETSVPLDVEPVAELPSFPPRTAMRRHLVALGIVLAMLAVGIWQWSARHAVVDDGEALVHELDTPVDGEPRADAVPASDGAEADNVVAVPITYMPGREEVPNVSPDGSLVAFSAQPDADQPRRVYLQAIDGGAARPISTVEVISEAAPVFSPDGRRLLFQRNRADGCTFIISSVLGGVEQTIGRCDPNVLTHVDWTPDSKGLLLPYVREDGSSRMLLHLLDLGTGELTPLDYDAGTDANDVQARYSPDGHQIAFRRGVLPSSDLFVMNADGSEQHQLTRFGSSMPGFDWSSDGRTLLFASDHDGGLRLWRVDVRSGQITPTTVRGVSWPDNARHRDLLVFTRGVVNSELVEVQVDGTADSAPRVVERSSRADWMPSLSPDGKRLAFMSDRLGQYAMYVRDASGSRKLSEHGDMEPGRAAWSPDGRQLTYFVAGGGGHLFIADVASGRVREVTPANLTVSMPIFTADGRSILFGGRSDDQWNLWRLALDGTQPEQVTRDGGTAPQLIDDHTVLYLDSNAAESWRQLDLVTGRRSDPGISGVSYWNHAGWLATRDGVFLMRESDHFGLYWRAWGDAEWQLVEPLNQEDLADYTFSLSPDHRRLIYSRVRQLSGDIYRIEGRVQ